MITNLSLFENILTHVEQKKPCSVIRFGDGEFLVANRMEQENVSYSKHLGYIPEEKHKNEIAENIKLACINADFCGITRNTGKSWGISKEYFNNLTQGIVCDADFHNYFLEHRYFDTIIKNTYKLLYISGHNLTKGFNRAYPHLTNIETFRIPLQYKYFGQQNRRHYPDVYNAFIKWVRQQDLTGYVALVGAGFVGKQYLIELAKAGAVAIDIGSVFDRYSGKITRGKLKGTKDNTYKL